MFTFLGARGHKEHHGKRLLQAALSALAKEQPENVSAELVARESGVAYLPIRTREFPKIGACRSSNELMRSSPGAAIEDGAEGGSMNVLVEASTPRCPGVRPPF